MRRNGTQVSPASAKRIRSFGKRTGTPFSRKLIKFDIIANTWDAVWPVGASVTVVDDRWRVVAAADELDVHDALSGATPGLVTPSPACSG